MSLSRVLFPVLLVVLVLLAQGPQLCVAAHKPVQDPKGDRLTCPHNERWYFERPHPWAVNCQALGKPQPQDDPLEERGGCDCKQGFYRVFPSGVCVSLRDCLREYLWASS